MLVFICQGFSNFSGFLHHFVLAKLATSRIRVKTERRIGRISDLKWGIELVGRLQREVGAASDGARGCISMLSSAHTWQAILPWVGLHTVNTKRYDTGTGETVPVVSVSLTVKRYLWSPRPDQPFYDIHVANKCGSIPQFYDNNQ